MGFECEDTERERCSVMNEALGVFGPSAPRLPFLVFLFISFLLRFLGFICSISLFPFFLYVYMVPYGVYEGIGL